MSRSASVQSTLDGMSVALLPPDFVKRVGDSLVGKAMQECGYEILAVGKNSISYLSYLVAMPGSLASGIRHIADQLIPSMVIWAQALGKDIQFVATPFSGLIKGVVIFADFFEIINDVQWFANGGLAKAYAKGEYFKIVAQIFLIPADLTTIVWWSRENNVGSFAFLGNFGASIGSLPYMSFIGHIALAPVAYTTLCLSYTFFALNSVQKCFHYENRIKDLTSDPKDLTLPGLSHNGGKVGRGEDGTWKVYTHFQSEEDKKNYLQHTQHKLANKRWDVITSVTKFLINAAILATLVKIPLLIVLGASPVGMTALALVAIFCVGRGLYDTHFYHKPTVHYTIAAAPAA